MSEENQWEEVNKLLAETTRALERTGKILKNHETRIERLENAATISQESDKG